MVVTPAFQAGYMGTNPVICFDRNIKNIIKRKSGSVMEFDFVDFKEAFS